MLEMEQAADSARVAATADAGLSAAARELIEVAHGAMCMLKAAAK